MIPKTRDVRGRLEEVYDDGQAPLPPAQLAELQAGFESARSSAWSLFVRPAPSDRILLVTDAASASAFVLSNFYSQVHVFVKDSSACTCLQNVYQRFADNIKVYAWEDIDQKARIGNPTPQ